MRAHRLGGGRPSWTLQIHPKAAAELSGLPADLQSRISHAFRNLEIDPITPRPGADVKRLVEAPAGILYRIRVGDARACYIPNIAEHLVTVMSVGHRGLGYDRMITTAIARWARVKPDGT